MAALQKEKQQVSWHMNCYTSNIRNVKLWRQEKYHKERKPLEAKCLRRFLCLRQLWKPNFLEGLKERPV